MPQKHFRWEKMQAYFFFFLMLEMSTSGKGNLFLAFAFAISPWYSKYLREQHEQHGLSVSDCSWHMADIPYLLDYVSTQFSIPWKHHCQEMRFWGGVRSAPMSAGTPPGMKSVTEMFSKRTPPCEGKRDIYLVEGKTGLVWSEWVQDRE